MYIQLQYLSILLGLLVTGDRTLPCTQQPAPGHTVELRISKVNTAEGQMMIAVYNDAAHFLTNKTVKAVIVPVQTEGELPVLLRDLVSGEYAISVFHDVNGNGILDKNILGIPTEPYGFSNDARGRFGPPKFRDAAVRVDGETDTVHIRLK